MTTIERIQHTRRQDDAYPSSDDDNADSLSRRNRRFTKSYITSAAGSRKAVRPAPPQELDEDGCELPPRPKRTFFRSNGMKGFDLGRLGVKPVV